MTITRPRFRFITSKSEDSFRDEYVDALKNLEYKGIPYFIYVDENEPFDKLITMDLSTIIGKDKIMNYILPKRVR